MGILERVRRSGAWHYEVVEDDGNGGSQTVTDWLGLETGSGQTLVEAGGRTDNPIEFDTIFDQGGTAITWDIGTPDAIVLAKGWYSAVATLFFAEQQADAATAVFVATVGQHAGLPMVQELGPEQSQSYQPGGDQVIFVSMPSFLCPADGGVLFINGGIRRGATEDTTLTFSEVLVVKIADAT